MKCRGKWKEKCRGRGAEETQRQWTDEKDEDICKMMPVGFFFF